MRRCFVFLLAAMLTGAVASAQLVNNGATITVQSGATIKCTGAIINNSGGTIQNSGTVSSDADLRNESGGTLSGTGTYEATSKFINNGNAFAGINLKLIGNVNTDSIKSGAGSSFANVNLAKGPGNTATLSDAMTVTGAFTFDNDDNRLILEDENLIMGPSATFVSADNNEFVVTNYTGGLNNSTGTVTKQNLGSTAFTYEVGFGAGEYNPVSISNTGTTDNINVRCLQNVLANGLTGSPITSHFAKNSWVVTEAVAGGSNLQLIAGWAASDEPVGVSNFNRAKVGIAKYNSGIDWDLPASNVIAASGSGPYTRNRNGITSTGVFAVADLAQVNTAKLNLKVYLQGPGITNVSGIFLMGDLLRDDPATVGTVDPVIPTIQPYSAALNTRFTRVGIYDGSATVNETINPSVFNTTGNDAIVDWVYISTLDPTAPSTKLQTRAALLQRDGDVVDLDGVSPVSVPIDNDGNYHILVGHRNHLSIRTATSKALADNSTFAFNFSSAQTQAYQDGTITANAAMKDLGNGIFALWGGNASGNNVVRYSTPGNDPAAILAFLGGITTGNVSNIYSIMDVNMNRRVFYSTPGNDPAFILGQVLGSVTTVLVTEHL